MNRERPSGPLLSRAEQIQNLKTKEFDVLVIGGGATGQVLEFFSVNTVLLPLLNKDSEISGKNVKYIIYIFFM